VPHESVLDSLASTFTPFVPDWDESDPDSCQSTYFSAQHGLQPPPDWVMTEDAAHQFERGILTTGKEIDVHLLERRLDDRRNLFSAKRHWSEVHRHFRDDSPYRQARRTGGTTAGRACRSEQWVANESNVLGRLSSAGVSVPPSEVLWPFAPPHLSDGPGVPSSETTLAALDVETRKIVDEAAASAAGVGLAKPGVIDVTTLGSVESLEENAAVAHPQRPPINLEGS
jgi:hypothetical protein